MFIIVKKYHIICAVAAICLLIGAAVLIGTVGGDKEPAVQETAGWGLSFLQDGQTPTGNASSDYLRKFNAYYTGDTTRKTIYLTFDAGYENGNTAAILDTLKAHNVSATFFLVGNYLETQPELVKRMAAEGHTVGNHTYTHPDMSVITDKETFTSQLTRMEQLYKEVTGSEMTKLYRPPQGKYSEQNLQYAKEMGYSTIFWSLAYVDWYENDQPQPQAAIDKLCARIHPGAIVLLHSTSSTNAQILDTLLTKWSEMGYTFGKLTDLTGAQS